MNKHLTRIIQGIIEWVPKVIPQDEILNVRIFLSFIGSYIFTMMINMKYFPKNAVEASLPQHANKHQS